MLCTEHTDATQVLVLMNAVHAPDLRDNEFYEELVEDIRTECARFGEVLEVVIPRPPNDKEIREWKESQFCP